MLKILYAVQATGNGHITRAREMAKAFTRLQNEGHQLSVQWLFSGRPQDQLFEMELFPGYECKRGLSFCVKNGRIDHLATFKQNSLRSFSQELKTTRVSQYDLLINDFEPVTAWAARKQGTECIGVSHQMAFRYDIPRVPGNHLAKQILRWFAPVDQAIGIHWHHFNAPLLPPIIEHFKSPELNNSPLLPRQQQILVYYPFVALSELIRLFSHFPDYQFHIFYPVKKSRSLAHIHVYPISRQQFQTKQRICGGVITAAGFELPSEAIVLGQKLLLIPVKGQFEQESNALALHQMDRATVIQQLNKEQLKSWLQQPTFPPVQYPDVASALAKWIANGRSESLESLSKRLWCQQPSIADRKTDLVDQSESSGRCKQKPHSNHLSRV